MCALSIGMASISSARSELQDLGSGRADVELAELLQVREAVEEEDALDELVGVLHLVDRLFVDVLARCS